jgi:hypothetical protein
MTLVLERFAPCRVTPEPGEAFRYLNPMATLRLFMVTEYAFALVTATACAIGLLVWLSVGWISVDKPLTRGEVILFFLGGPIGVATGGLLALFIVRFVIAQKLQEVRKELYRLMLASRSRPRPIRIADRPMPEPTIPGAEAVAAFARRVEKVASR